MENTHIGSVLGRSTIPPPTSALDGEGRRRRYEIEEQQQRDENRLRRRGAVWKTYVQERGERYAACRLDNFLATSPAQVKALADLQGYAASIDANIQAGKNVLLLGPPGTGKDHLATGLAYVAAQACHGVLWVDGTALWATFRKAIAGENGHAGSYRDLSGCTWDARLKGDETDIVKKLAGVDLLIISDPVPPGAPLTEYQAGQFFRIIDRRYSAMKATVVTINVANRAEAEQRMGTQTVDRLAHGALVVACNWPSYRQKKS